MPENTLLNLLLIMLSLIAISRRTRLEEKWT